MYAVFVKIVVAFFHYHSSFSLLNDLMQPGERNPQFGRLAGSITLLLDAGKGFLFPKNRMNPMKTQKAS